jgi:hypothetical protein
VPYVLATEIICQYRLGPIWWTSIGRSSKVEGRVEVVTCLLGILFGEEVWLRR